MNRILAEQKRRNRANRKSWALYSSHREQVTQLLCAQAQSPNNRLCVLGAGNCNDLDLAKLAAAFREVDLVDWDADAMEEGVAQQNLATSDRERIHLAGDVDLTGIAADLACYSPDSPPPDAKIEQLIEVALSTQPLASIGAFQVVASVCTLTQLIEAVAMSLGVDHPRYMDLLTAVRIRHLRLLVELAAPHGVAVLITDIVSSATYPPLPQTPPNQLSVVLTQLINQQNFFSGVNPVVLEALFRADPCIARRIAAAKLLRPWLWDLGPRVFAVCAIAVPLNESGS